MERRSEIKVEQLKITDVAKVLKMYNESSTKLRQIYDPWILTSRIGQVHLYLSATPLKPLLLWQITALVAKTITEVVGFVYIKERIFVKNNRKDVGIVVKEGFQEMRIGDKLMREILKGQDNVWLTTLYNNERMISLAKKYGFVAKRIFMVLERKDKRMQS